MPTRRRKRRVNCNQTCVVETPRSRGLALAYQDNARSGVALIFRAVMGSFTSRVVETPRSGIRVCEDLAFVAGDGTDPKELESSMCSASTFRTMLFMFADRCMRLRSLRWSFGSTWVNAYICQFHTVLIRGRDMATHSTAARMLRRDAPRQ